MVEKPVFVNILDYEKDEHTLEMIGGAILSMWPKLPEELKEDILTAAENLVFPKPPSTKVRKRFESLVKYNST